VSNSGENIAEISRRLGSRNRPSHTEICNLHKSRCQKNAPCNARRHFLRIIPTLATPTHSHLRGAWETPISFTLMVHHIVLYKLNPEVTPARVEEMMMNARMQLLKIPEVLSIKCGKRIEPEMEWPFFIAIDFESMDKFAIFCEDSIYVKFVEEVIKPNTEDSLTLDFEMDPGKDVRFS
jgi:hypothetical protein